MRSIFILDDGLIERAGELTGVSENTTLVHEATTHSGFRMASKSMADAR